MSRNKKILTMMLGVSVAASITVLTGHDGRSGSRSADAGTAPPSVHTGGEPYIEGLPKTRELPDITMPLDAYKGSLKHIQVIDQARSLAARNCMVSLGFNDWTTSIIAISKPSDVKEFDLLEHLDSTTAAESGYPDTALNNEVPGADARRGNQERHASKEEIASFTGSGSSTSHNGKSITPSGSRVPEGGCLGQADRQIKSLGGELSLDPREIAPDAMFAARDDSRVQAAFKTWSECMSKEGMHYLSPLAAQIDPRWGQRTTSTPAEYQEKQTAAADARCRQETKLVEIYKTVEAAYQQRLVDQNQPQLEAAIITFRQWVKAAQGLLEQS